MDREEGSCFFGLSVQASQRDHSCISSGVFDYMPFQIISGSSEVSQKSNAIVFFTSLYAHIHAQAELSGKN